MVTKGSHLMIPCYDKTSKYHLTPITIHTKNKPTQKTNPKASKKQILLYEGTVDKLTQSYKAKKIKLNLIFRKCDTYSST